MDVQRVERVADLVRDAGRQKGQGMKPFAFDGLEGLLPRFGGVVQNQGHARTAPGLPVQGRGVKAQEAGTRIRNLKLIMRGPLDARRAGRAHALPIQFGQEIGDGTPFDLFGRPIEQADHRLVKIDNPPGLIGHHHAVLDGIEESLQELALPRQALDDRLHTLGIQASDPAQDTIKKAGFNRSHTCSIDIASATPQAPFCPTSKRQLLPGRNI